MEVEQSASVFLRDIQRELLEEEGIVFDTHARISLRHYQWKTNKNLSFNL